MKLTLVFGGAAALGRVGGDAGVWGAASPSFL